MVRIFEWGSRHSLTFAGAMLTGKDRLQRSVLQMREGAAGEELVGLAFRGASPIKEASASATEIGLQYGMPAKSRCALFIAPGLQSSAFGSHQIGYPMDLAAS